MKKHEQIAIEHYVKKRLGVMEMGVRGEGEGRVLGGRFHGEELHCLYSSPSAVKVTQLSDITHVARVGRMKMHTKFYLET